MKLLPQDFILILPECHIIKELYEYKKNYLNLQ